MFGRLNVVDPFPPNFVPRSANSALFWDGLRDCPLQANQPTGTK